MSKSRYGKQANINDNNSNTNDSTDQALRSQHSISGRITYRIIWTAVFIAVKSMFRIKVIGRENFPTGPFILSPVHRSFIDTPIAAMITPRRMRFMGKENLWDSRLLGGLLSILGGFPVERGTADRTALRAAEDVLALGEPLVMFPEGTRREGAQVNRDDMHDGPAFVAARAGVPIVPVGLGGTVQALPIGKKIPRPRKVVAVVGTPIQPPERPDPPSDEPKTNAKPRISRRSVTELTDDLHQSLQILYPHAQDLAGT